MSADGGVDAYIQAAHCTRGRGGHRVVALVPHIAEGGMASVDATFAGGGRQASAHFCVEGTTVHQYVGLDDTAWAVGDFEGNQETVSVEHAGTTAHPPTRQTLETSAHLFARLARLYGWDRLVLGENVRLHKWYSATSCPSTMDVGWLVARANEILGGNDMTADDVWSFDNGGDPRGRNAWRQLNDLTDMMGTWWNGQDGAHGLLYNVYDTNAKVTAMAADVAALTEAVRVLAQAQGADPDAIARIVAEAVQRKLEGIDLSVTVSDDDDQ